MKTHRAERHRQESTPSRLLAVLLTSAALTLAVLAPSAPPAYAAPPAALSYYIQIYDLSWAYQVGCNRGKADSAAAGTQRHVAILDFGSMYLSGSVWKVSLFGSPDIPLSSARLMVEQFGRGYHICTGADLTSTVYVGLGINNSAGDVTSAAGAVLAKQAQIAQNTLAANGWTQSFAIGANDFEAWNGDSADAAAARAWIDGYNSVTIKPFFVNYGSANGCPSTTVPTPTSCSAGLPAETIWRVSWSGVAYPVPEIYATSGVNAKQWRYLSLYSYLNHGSRFFFKGVMTQSGACAQKGGCTGTNNGPSAGWDQLNVQVNSDSRTATTPDGPTDISWH